MLGELVTAARSGLGTTEAAQIFSSYEAEPWYGAREGFVLGEVAWAQLGAWCNYDRDDDLLHLRVPTFAVLVAMEPLVPVRASLDRYRETAALADSVRSCSPTPTTGSRPAPASPRDTMATCSECRALTSACPPIASAYQNHRL